MSEFFALVTFAMIATISPGGSTTAETASGTRFGVARSLPLLAGILAGLEALLFALSIGLGALILEYPSAQFGLRVIGSAYLLWLAWTIMRQSAPQKGTGPDSLMSFTTGVLLLWLNPKTWTMATAAVSWIASRMNGSNASRAPLVMTAAPPSTPLTPTLRRLQSVGTADK